MSEVGHASRWGAVANPVNVGTTWAAVLVLPLVVYNYIDGEPISQVLGIRVPLVFYSIRFLVTLAGIVSIPLAARVSASLPQSSGRFPAWAGPALVALGEVALVLMPAAVMGRMSPRLPTAEVRHVAGALAAVVLVSGVVVAAISIFLRPGRLRITGTPEPWLLVFLLVHISCVACVVVNWMFPAVVMYIGGLLPLGIAGYKTAAFRPALRNCHLRRTEYFVAHNLTGLLVVVPAFLAISYVSNVHRSPDLAASIGRAMFSLLLFLGPPAAFSLLPKNSFSRSRWFSTGALSSGLGFSLALVSIGVFAGQLWSDLIYLLFLAFFFTLPYSGFALVTDAVLALRRRGRRSTAAPSSSVDDALSPEAVASIAAKWRFRRSLMVSTLVLASLASVLHCDVIEDPEDNATRMNALGITHAMETLYLDDDFVPASIGELEEHCQTRWCRNLIRVDGWKRPFQISNHDGFFYVVSSGEDGTFGTDDDVSKMVNFDRFQSHR